MVVSTCLQLSTVANAVLLKSNETLSCQAHSGSRSGQAMDVIERLRVRFPVRATLCNECGQVDFFGDDAAFYQNTSISCLIFVMIIVYHYETILMLYI